MSTTLEVFIRTVTGLLAVIGLSFLNVSCGHSPTPGNALNGLALTPPMGWNSWNTFMGGATDSLLRQVADAMVTNGMRDVGYQYVNIDDGWALPQRVNGHLQPNPAKFPDGFKPLTDYLLAKGLKFGIYADRGKSTCVSHSPGSYGHEITDAADFASWGVDYVKYDNCNPAFFSTQEGDYRQMRDALLATGRPIIFSICAWNFKNWMPNMGNLWCTSDDIRDDWSAITNIIDQNEKSAQYAGPGRWNDPDMLVVGCSNIPDLQHHPEDGMSELVGSNGLTDVEIRAHFSMWAMMAAPLIAGNDVRNMPKKIKEILLNKEVITVDQDPMGSQCVKVWDDGKGSYVYSKTLKGVNAKAIALFNRSDSNQTISANWVDIGMPSGNATVRDLWNHTDLGTFANSFKAFVPSHAVVLLKIVGSISR